MIHSDQSIPFVILSLCLLLLIGIVILTWGGRFLGKGSILIWFGLFVVIAGIGFDGGLFSQEEFQVKIWKFEWFWSHVDREVITIGVYQDLLSMIMSFLVLVLLGSFLMNQSVICREVKPEKILAALAISSAGVILSWVSLTPWLVLFGLMLTILAGFIALDSRGNLNAEAGLASRFIQERVLGYLFLFFGVCLIATTKSVASHDVAQLGGLLSTKSGWVLLILGLFVQIQSFPFSGWKVMDSCLYSPATLLLNQIFPVWSVFSLLVRLQPQLVQMNLHLFLGWVALISSFLTLLSGLFQKNWKLGVGAWFSAGLSLSVALLTLSDAYGGMGFFIGVSLGALCLSGVAISLEPESKKTMIYQKRAFWLKIVLFLGMASGTGAIGFISATSGIYWMLKIVLIPEVLIPFLLVFFLYSVFGWKLVWNIYSFNRYSEISWIFIFTLFLWVFLALSLWWTGSMTGGVIPGVSDRFFSSLFEKFFQNQSNDNVSDFLTVSGLYWGTMLIAILTAYWMSGRKEDQWIGIIKVFPRLTHFFETGYYVNAMGQRIQQGISWVGSFLEKIIDDRIWMEWIPGGFDSSLKRLGMHMNRLGEGMSFVLESFLRKLIEIPAKILQWIQTGDLRWYLCFSFGFSFLLFIYFLKL